MLGGPSPQHLVLLGDQSTDRIGVTSTRQIPARCCSESTRRWRWSRARLMRSPPGQIGWPWREWCRVRRISRARSHPAWHSGSSGCKRNAGWKAASERTDLANDSHKACGRRPPPDSTAYMVNKILFTPDKREVFCICACTCNFSLTVSRTEYYRSHKTSSSRGHFNINRYKPS